MYVTIYIAKIVVSTIFMLKLSFVPTLANISLPFNNPAFKEKKNLFILRINDSFSFGEVNEDLHMNEVQKTLNDPVKGEKGLC